MNRNELIEALYQANLKLVEAKRYLYEKQEKYQAAKARSYLAAAADPKVNHYKAANMTTADPAVSEAARWLNTAKLNHFAQTVEVGRLHAMLYGTPTNINDEAEGTEDDT